MREISAIVFDVTIESDAHTDVDVMRRIFGYSPAVRLREISPLTYQAGSYRRELTQPEVWIGRLDRIRTDPISQLHRYPDGEFHFIDDKTQIPTTQATTYFAFVPHAKLLIYRDTAEMPYTRMSSYVSAALDAAATDGFSAYCGLEPRMTSRPLREWLQHFSAIDRVRVEFRHSQSPGNRAIDRILEQLNAQTMIEVVSAAPKEQLNKTVLLNTEAPVGQALDHLDQSAKNGHAEITGHVGGVRTRFTTKSPVERHMLEVEEDVARMRTTFARFASKLSSLRIHL